ncbi:MAG: UbiA family prenyltransferase [Candidatus Eremiobacteraeota bacterium]|nr:UbiA family prenyltransferase [Candidatus Eremiobacteraeota bacterium]MBV8366407.1 UbiA family prenyltransferase [Candidatus Eremiobacteraeota bacterium]
MNAIRAFVRDIKPEHTLFALPFAYAGALLAQGGLPPLRMLAWITVAVLGARTAAMAANRLIDARIDARNPRTAARPLATGELHPAVMAVATVVGLVLLTIAAWQLNPLCLALVPLGALLLVVYPFVKRFSWGVHFLLGAVDALAPLGGWLAVTGRFEWPSLILFLAVTLWVAGFDILYALMDYDFDVREGIRSIPARFGTAAGRMLPLVLHVVMLVLLAWLGVIVHAHPLYWCGLLAGIVLVAYEAVLIRRRAGDVFALNAAVFNANMTFSVIFLLTTAASLLIAQSSPGSS